MAKSKSSVQKDDTMRQSLSGIKNGSVKKNKNPKNTLTDKVALISNSTAKIKTAALKTPQKDAVVKGNQSSSKNNPKQSKENQGSPREKQSSQSKMMSKKIDLSLEKEETDDSDSDIDEGIIPQDEVSMSDETFEDEEDSDTDLPDILGKSLKDESDEDDGDFEVKEEKDKKSLTKIDRRTIFIDNIPKETKLATVKKVFGQYGPINNLRFRSIIPESTKISKKVAAIKNQIHPKVTTVTAYVNYKSEESAKKALDMNGKMFQGNYVHVRIVAKSERKEFDSKKAVFLGNLKFGIDNNTVWKHFGECGDIESVYLLRDSKTGQAKGSGYINFKTEDAATLALKLNGTEILNRPIRVKPYLGGKKQNENKEKGKKRDSSEFADNKPGKKFKNNLGKAVLDKSETVGKAKKHHESQKSHGNLEAKQTSFQGQKSDIKQKKKNHNKLNKKRKEMAKKLVAK
ncbi:RNA-binding protein [Ooceraea biroi]|uniref:RNA-binding protein n=1 Tax=Ooceraea biroi TaxID=2015173 RepID=A0A026WXL4_OOCBI|nr:RNA-binding protein [Ooceraea biroi]